MNAHELLEQLLIISKNYELKDLNVIFINRDDNSTPINTLIIRQHNYFTNDSVVTNDNFIFTSIGNTKYLCLKEFL